MTLIIERDVESYLTAQVKARGGMCVKYPATVISGFPDRIVLLPGGRIAFVEVKRPKKYKVGELQKYWQDKLRSLGFTSEVVKSKDEVDAFMLKMAEGIDLNRSIKNYVKEMNEL